MFVVAMRKCRFVSGVVIAEDQGAIFILAVVGIIQFFKTVSAVNIFCKEKLCAIDKFNSPLDNSYLWRTSIKPRRGIMP